MPSIQLDAPVRLDAAAKRELAREFGEAYARVMQVDAALVTVVVRDLDPGSVWRCTAPDPSPVALLMCDVRRGRDRDVRAELARTLIRIGSAATGIGVPAWKVEFTQHDGDEMFHPHLGGFNRDWSAEEQRP